jgi:hypothetical protein
MTLTKIAAALLLSSAAAQSAVAQTTSKKHLKAEFTVVMSACSQKPAKCSKTLNTYHADAVFGPGDNIADYWLGDAPVRLKFRTIYKSKIKKKDFWFAWIPTPSGYKGAARFDLYVLTMNYKVNGKNCTVDVIGYSPIATIKTQTITNYCTITVTS